MFAQNSTNALVEQVKKDAPVAWTSYLRSWDKWQISYTERITDGDAKVEDNSGTMLLAYPNMLHQKVDNLNSMTRLVGFNNRYRFALERKEDEHVWTIDYVEPLKGVSSYEESRFPVLFENNVVSVELFIANTFARGFMFSLGDWFPTIFAQPEFILLEAQEIMEDDETCVWIKYDYDPPVRNTQLLRGGEVVLMPNHSWLIKRADIRLLEPNGKIVTARIDCEYNFLPDAIPQLKSHTMYLKDYGYTFHRSFENCTKREDIDPNEFSLRHYGFPEPDFDERRPNRIRYVLMITGGLMIAYALWQMYHKRKEQKA